LELWRPGSNKTALRIKYSASCFGHIPIDHERLLVAQIMVRFVSRWSFMMMLVVTISGCDDSVDQPCGGTPGGPSQSDLYQGEQIGNAVSGTQPITGAGGAPDFGSPQDTGQFGVASFTASSVAKIDTDGDPSEQGYDVNWNAQTSGNINGQPVNSAEYAYVVMSQGQMAASGAQIGDWALVTNNATGQTVWARVEDVGPPNGTGEISEAAATAVGIQFQRSSWTVGNPTVTVQVYSGTASISGGND
jgi:hypothetical protein